jgi:hypothetical protein
MRRKLLLPVLVLSVAGLAVVARSALLSRQQPPRASFSFGGTSSNSGSVSSSFGGNPTPGTGNFNPGGGIRSGGGFCFGGGNINFGGGFNGPGQMSNPAPGPQGGFASRPLQ